jgi:E3 ubiquitin-protein ligase MARCH6
MITGSILLLIANTLTKFPAMSIYLFAINNIVGFVTLSWGIGIAFMLTTTISILQLREVLHPDFLAKVIRPQEVHADLLAALLNDSLLSQVRRLLVSCAVYFGLIFVFVWLPVKLFSLAFMNSTSAIKIYFWSFSPELQIPLEVGLIHTVFLIVLERYKDVVGRAQFLWLHYASKKLGIHRYLLPFVWRPAKVFLTHHIRLHKFMLML